MQKLIYNDRYIATDDEARDIIDGEVVRPQGRLVAKEVAE